MKDFGNLNSEYGECHLCSSRNHTTVQHQQMNDAAPELYEALKFYVEICGNTAYQVSRDTARAMYEKGSAALAKAVQS